MQYALVDGRRTEAFVGGNGVCETCGAAMVAKCGPRVMHDWAHPSRRNCDPWWENETPWHRAWKNLFPELCREISHVAPDGEIHRADTKTPTGIVIEVQHSAMTDQEKLSREAFYGNLVWVLDGSTFRDNFQIHHMLPDPTSATAQDLIWIPAGPRLHGANGGIFLRLSECLKENPTVTKATARGGWMHFLRDIEPEVVEAYRGHHQYVWVRPRRTWLEATHPVYIDFGEDWLARLDTYDESGLLCLFRVAKHKFLNDAMADIDARAIGIRYYPLEQSSHDRNTVASLPSS